MRLHSRLETYLSSVEYALAALADADVEVYTEELLTPERANLQVRIRFGNGRLLEISEAVVVADGELQHLDYRYHCQRRDNRLVFRYDTAPHFPELPGYPRHKHLPNRTVPAERPTLSMLVVEASAVP
ncbi:MAG: DUF6516 family protein [Thiohalocapsa sp.]|nr:DUF6516 family protein [Thiohalocapsa sp.]